MKILSSFIYKTLKKIPEKEKKRTRATVLCVERLGYSLKEMRPSLLKLAKIKISSLMNSHPLSVASLYHNRKGVLGNGLSKSIMAEALNLPANEILPPQERPFNLDSPLPGPQQAPPERRRTFPRDMKENAKYNALHFWKCTGQEQRQIIEWPHESS